MQFRKPLTFLAAATMAVAVPLSAAAKPPGGHGPTAPTGTTCQLPESDAEALVILSNYYPGYWWDHTDLTIAAQSHPSATDEELAAIEEAIATWSSMFLIVSTA